MNLNEVVQEDVTAQEAFEQRSEGGEGIRFTDTWEKSICVVSAIDPDARVTGAKGWGSCRRRQGAVIKA